MIYSLNWDATLEKFKAVIDQGQNLIRKSSTNSFEIAVCMMMTHFDTLLAGTTDEVGYYTLISA